MTLSIDDLEKIYGDAYWTRPELEPDGARRAGIIAVVTALRDEMAGGTAWHLLNEILGDAGEKVGTHGSPELDEDARKLEAMGQDPGMTLEELLAPAPAPDKNWAGALQWEADCKAALPDAAPAERSDATAVCVWTNGFVSYENRKWWRAACGHSFYGTPTFENCKCGKPIKFTEAK